MDSDRVEAVNDWESKPFSEGYDGLRRLADREFSGAVTDGRTWLFMLNGTVVGVFDGSIKDFEDADGTAYAAPDPSLPLLYAMQETGGETRARYYTEDTDLEEVHETLTSGRFTGFVELSENVLSGDYYVVYHGGKSMSVAFVGNSRRLVTGDEAFERAADEVGLYEVRSVPIEPVEIPEPATEEPSEPADEAPSEPSESADATREETTADEAAAEETPAEGTPAEETTTESVDDAGEKRTSEEEPVERPSSEDTTRERSTASNSSAESADTRDPVDTESETEPLEETRQAEPSEPSEPSDRSGSFEAPRRREATDSTTARTPRTTESAAVENAETGAGPNQSASGDPTVDAERQWRETRTIPSLDPEQTVSENGGSPTRDDPETAQPDPDVRGRGHRQTTPREGARDERRERIESLEAELAELRAERDELKSERDRLAAEREELKSERDEYERRVEELESTVSELESRIETLRDRLSEAESPNSPEKRSMSADAAISGTNIFVRYDSRDDPTLADAVDGGPEPEEVNENLKLEYHTNFESDDVVVDGDPFPRFLERSTEYRFVRWFVRDLLYDIRDTGKQGRLKELYRAIPDVYRIDLGGEIELGVADSEEPVRHRFDVVFYDRRSNPLAVANLDDSLEGTSGDLVETLVHSASEVGEREESLSSAFFVTASYFEPAATDTVEEATGSGLLRREKRASFVSLSRKGGYHLCLVETGRGDFHVTVPEL